MSWLWRCRWDAWTWLGYQLLVERAGPSAFGCICMWGCLSGRLALFLTLRPNSKQWYPLEQGGTGDTRRLFWQQVWFHGGILLRMFPLEVGQEGRRPPWCCQHRDVGRTSIATRSQPLRQLLHGTPQGISQCCRLDGSKQPTLKALLMKPDGLLASDAVDDLGRRHGRKLNRLNCKA